MFALIAIFMLLGIILGHRFSVFTLIPATVFIVVALVGANMAFHYSLSSLAAYILLAVTAFQLSYVLGVSKLFGAREDFRAVKRA